MRSTEEVRSGVPFAEGDVLLAKITPCLENGKLGIASGIPGGWGMTSTEVYPLRAERVTTEFLACFLTLPSVRDGLTSKMQGATGRQRLPKEALDAFPIPVPPLPEQVLAATRQLKQSLLHHLFTYGPVPFPQAAHVPLKETEVGPMPEHWSVVSIGDIEIFMQYGTSSRCESGGSGLPVLRIPNVVGGRTDTADLKYLAASPTEVKRHLLQRGDLLFVRTNGVRENVGRCAVYLGSPARSLFASYLIRARLAPDRALPQFVQLFTETNTGRASFTGRASGAADGKFNINTQTIRSTILPLPPLSEQREIAAQLSTVDAKLAAEESRRAAVAALFQSLLHNLMTGQVRLPVFDRGNP
jgi:type I restriction enzyme S subunit